MRSKVLVALGRPRDPECFLERDLLVKAHQVANPNADALGAAIKVVEELVTGNACHLPELPPKLLRRVPDLLIGQHVTKAVPRTFEPNLKKKRLWVSELKRFVTVKLSARALKTVTKNGAYATLKKAGVI